MTPVLDRSSAGLILKLLLVVGLLMSALATSADADNFKEWNRRFESAKEDLAAGKAKNAIWKFDKVLAEYVELAGPGEANERNFGTLLVYRAIANQQAGRLEDARWDWDMAHNFLPEARSLELSEFGETGRTLKEYSARAAEEEAALPEATGEGEPAIGGAAVEAPRVRYRVKPKYTFGARHFDVAGALVVRVVIDESGRVRRPQVIEKLPTPGLSYTALEALRKWRFDPAKLDGKPVSVYYNLTINYRIP